MFKKFLPSKQLVFYSELNVDALHQRFLAHVDDEPRYHFDNHLMIPDALYQQTYAGYWVDNQFALRPIRQSSHSRWRYRIMQAKHVTLPMAVGNVVSKGEGSVIYVTLKPQNKLIISRFASYSGILLGMLLFQAPSGDVPYLIGFFIAVGWGLYGVFLRNIRKKYHVISSDLAAILKAKPTR